MDNEDKQGKTSLTRDENSWSLEIIKKKYEKEEEQKNKFTAWFITSIRKGQNTQVEMGTWITSWGKYCTAI